MEKPELRQKYKALRAALSLEDVAAKSLAIANNVLQLDVWDKTYFHLFLTIDDQREVQTDLIQHILWGRDKDIIVSKSDFENYTLQHFLLTESTRLMVNPYGIPEPAEGIEVLPAKVDVVFVPLLAFDNKGHRVGYGKGFYDRFLAECRPDVVKVGLSFFEAEPTEIPHSDTDIPLDFCVTPNGVVSF
ncbi:5-formyltetrahydrofolate cyclo-ligase [Flavobacterium sp. RHBU_3]|uniref:5-formyltetrahydrofolate cyclo-ligase n=1 Tax=Flavobacterium sp. RHBU_3 TaxID=3391184 RepID=UPI003984F053